MKRTVHRREIPPTTWGCKPITGYIPSLGTRVIVVVVVVVVVVVGARRDSPGGYASGNFFAVVVVVGARRDSPGSYDGGKTLVVVVVGARRDSPGSARTSRQSVTYVPREG